jgi:ribosomal protein S18 acetylase RimI-like enzyme
LIEYRTFQNDDPPKILDVWNSCRGSRGIGWPRGCDSLEQLLFSKPYFDRQGFFIAQENDRVIGFSHAGFSASDDKGSLDRSLGAVYMVQVRPENRRQGIARQLVLLGQSYLAKGGAQLQYLGGMFPLNAFYLGLYGGSELPGLLASDGAAQAFARSLGYQPCDECMVYQRKVGELPRVTDSRVVLLKRLVEVQAEPWPTPANWWDACVLGNMPSLRYEMIDKESQQPIGKAWVWEMESFGLAWKMPTVGIIDFWIEPAFRRKGYARLLLLTMLKHLRDQQIELVELQTMERNEAARKLYESVGFEMIDRGIAYRLNGPPDLSKVPVLSVPGSSTDHLSRVHFARSRA